MVSFPFSYDGLQRCHSVSLQQQQQQVDVPSKATRATPVNRQPPHLSPAHTKPTQHRLPTPFLMAPPPCSTLPQHETTFKLQAEEHTNCNPPNKTHSQSCTLTNSLPVHTILMGGMSTVNPFPFTTTKPGCTKALPAHSRLPSQWCFRLAQTLPQHHETAFKLT
jgi:hypothetical protein